METPVAQRLEIVRHAVLKLHKALLESERVTYEQAMGRIPSSSRFLQLVTRDPWFAWLQPLSQLIVSIDESQDAKVPVTTAELEAFKKEIRLLLAPSEAGEGFSRHYYEALQRDPAVVLTHAELMKLVGNPKSRTEAR